MGFRKRLNQHDAWNRTCKVNAALLAALPEFVVRSEVLFRTLLTEGEATGPAGEVFRLSGLDDLELADLRTFVYDRAQFDMDVLLFDALKREVVLRRSASKPL